MVICSGGERPRERARGAASGVVVVRVGGLRVGDPLPLRAIGRADGANTHRRLGRGSGGGGGNEGDRFASPFRGGANTDGLGHAGNGQRI